MKKLFALFIGLAALQTVACADDKPIALKDLPAAAQQFLKQYFPDVKAMPRSITTCGAKIMMF